MKAFTGNQKKLTYVYMISVVVQLVGYMAIYGTANVNWLIVSVLLISALVYTSTYYKLYSD